MISDEKREVLRLFAAGRDFYKLMKFKDAKDQFDRALAIDPTDGPSKVYLERCEYFIAHPPGPDWDGVFVMTTK